MKTAMQLNPTATPTTDEWDPDTITSADWATTTPAGESEGESCFFQLSMNCDANDGQFVILSRAEFIELKRRLAEMRGL
jgi:hypothetical protein